MWSFSAFIAYSALEVVTRRTVSVHITRLLTRGCYRLHGRVVKGVGPIGHDEVMEAGGREFDPRPGHYSRMSF